MVYAPGTLETDPKKQNMALQQHAQGIKTNTADIASLTTSIAGLAPLDSPTFTGTPAAPTPSTTDNSTKIATTAYVQANKLRVKVITFTFDTSLTTNFSVTGVGFAAKGAFFFATLSATQNVVAWGATDGTTSYELHGRGTTASVPNYGIDTTGASMVFDLVTTTGTTACSVGLVSVDSDGFTFSRASTGSPSGTATVFAMCFG